MLLFILALFAVVIVSYFLTERIRRFAIVNTIMDMPNHRSSHSTPTPRGGGLVIAFSAICCFVYLSFVDYLTAKESLGILLSFLIISVLAWQDDKKHIAILVRAICYFIAAICLVFMIDVSVASFNKLIVNFIFVVTIVWIVNLNNFMDGIDGIASIEALTTMFFGIFLFYQLQDIHLLIITAIISATVLGFLFLNWPPARIFMGDVGSCSLGLIFCIIALLAYKKHDASLIIWLILLSIFIVDATLTLIKRILTGQQWYSAHKQHAYQKLVQSGYSHKQVTLGVLVINIIFTWSMGYLVFIKPEFAIYCLVFTYGVLSIFWALIIFRLNIEKELTRQD